MSNSIKCITSVYPRLIEDDVYMCGFTSPKSYGGMSYFIRHAEGNWLVDSPRWEPALKSKFDAMGGLRYIFLTHRDDVADADVYARQFGAQQIIHEADRRAAPNASILVRGTDPFEPIRGFKIIPVPGHTRGHCVLLHDNKFLFTGDHLEWDPAVPGRLGGALNAYRDYCWYDWSEQTRSMQRLTNEQFEWILPGHGHRHKLASADMRVELDQLIKRMKDAA